MNETAESMDFEDSETTETASKKSLITDEIKVAFNAAIEAGKEEDLIKIDLIAAGAKFSNATRIYNELMVEAGLAVSKEEKAEVVANACAEADLSTEEGFDAAVKFISDSIESVTDRSAAGMIRAYAKKNDIEFFKKPKKVGGGTRTSFLGDFYDALVENPNMTEEEATAFIDEHGTPNTKRWESTHQKARAMANRIAERYAQ